jgi:putative ribosome biogenesis GTPase RsgA
MITAGERKVREKINHLEKQLSDAASAYISTCHFCDKCKHKINDDCLVSEEFGDLGCIYRAEYIELLRALINADDIVMDVGE